MGGLATTLNFGVEFILKKAILNTDTCLTIILLVRSGRRIRFEIITV